MKKLFLYLVITASFKTIYGQTFQSSYSYDNTVISAFHQGNKGDYNCASIAVIKCCIATFGIDSVFRSVNDLGDRFEITFRNNETISLTKQELAKATQASGFVLDSNKVIFDKAHFIYAVMVKRAINNPNKVFKSCTNFDNALIFLHGENGGIDATNLPALIGVTYKFVDNYQELSYVYGNFYHAAFASKDVFDDYGEAHPFNNYWNKHNSWIWFWKNKGTSFKLADISTP